MIIIMAMAIGFDVCIIDTFTVRYCKNFSVCKMRKSALFSQPLSYCLSLF